MKHFFLDRLLGAHRTEAALHRLAPLVALLLVGRLWHFGVGFVLYRAHRLHALGNDVLGGREVPILPCVLVVFALGMILPFPVRMLLLGLITR